MTRQKLAILRVLRGTISHPTADWVYGEVRKEIPDISLGTVYRNLRRLEEDGEIRELDFGGGVSRFDGDIQPHYHFRCEKCGRVFDVAVKTDSGIDKRVALETGFRVLYHLLEFRGFCRDCRSVVDT